MNEEKKLSQVLDEIFGEYIINKNFEGMQSSSQPKAILDSFNPKEYHVKEQENFFEPESLIQPKDTLKLDFFVSEETKNKEYKDAEPAIVQSDLISLIENLFASEKVINETDLSFNRIAVKPVPPIASPWLTETKVETTLQNSRQETNFFKKEHNKKLLTSIQQAYVAKAICSQLYELFYVYSQLIKLSRKFKTSQLISLRKGINEIKPVAEFVYEKIARQSISYFHENTYFNSDNAALLIIKNRTNTILSDVEILINNVGKDLESHLENIKTLLTFQLETINNM